MRNERSHRSPRTKHHRRKACHGTTSGGSCLDVLEGVCSAGQVLGQIQRGLPAVFWHGHLKVAYSYAVGLSFGSCYLVVIRRDERAVLSAIFSD